MTPSDFESTVQNSESKSSKPPKKQKIKKKVNNPRRSNDERCTDFLSLLPEYLFSLGDDARKFITTTAWEHLERYAHPRIAYYMRWSREMLEDGEMPTHKLFAERIDVSEMTVTRIRRQALHQYVRAVEQVYLLYELYVNHPDAISIA